MWTTTGLPASTSNTGSPRSGPTASSTSPIRRSRLRRRRIGELLRHAEGLRPPVDRGHGQQPDLRRAGRRERPVYVGSWNAKLYAFDAAGSTNCRGATGKSARRCGPPPPPPASEGRRRSRTASSTPSRGTARCPRSTPPGRRTARNRHRENLHAAWHSAAGAGGYVTSSSPAVANGASTSPRPTAGPTGTRRRVAELLRLRRRQDLLPALGRRLRLHRRRIAHHGQRGPLHQRPGNGTVYAYALTA